MKTVDKILRDDIKICQPKQGFRFGVDSVVLAWFTRIKKNDKVIDVGSGSGVIATLLVKMGKALNIDAIEIQPEMFACLDETVEINNLRDNITTHHSDIKLFKPAKKYDILVCNPPYRKINTGKENIDIIAQKARFNIELSIDELLQFAKKHVRFGGRVYIVFDTDRMAHIIETFKKFGFEPKKLLLLYPELGKKCKLFFLEAVYGAGEELEVLPPLFQKGGIESEQYKNIFLREWK